MMSRGGGGPVLVATATPLIPFPTVTPPVLRVANSKEKRSHSAHTLHSSRNASVCSGREPVDLPKRKRVQSAVEGRQVVKLSLADTPYGSKVWGETSYTANYQEKKPIPLPKVRPASATRMNNPHPSQLFLQWRIPTRIHPHDRSVQPSHDILKDIQEDFYKDYSSNVRPGDDKCEVPITNVAKIPFPGGKKNFGLELAGKSMKLTTRGTRSSSSLARGRANNDQHLERLLKPTSHAALKDWIRQANPNEKAMFDKMLSATQTEKYETKRLLSQVFNPSSESFMQDWLKTIDGEERGVAMNVLQDLAQISQKYKVKPTSSQRHAKHCKARTWPKQSRSSSGIQPVQLGIQGVSVIRPHSADKSSQSSSSGVGSTYRHAIKSQCKSEILWNHRVKPPQKSRPLMGGGSVFSKPHEARGQHFALHPEWPIA